MRQGTVDSRGKSSAAQLGIAAVVFGLLAWAGLRVAFLGPVGIFLAILGIVFAAAGLIDARAQKRSSGALALLGMLVSVSAAAMIAAHPESISHSTEPLVQIESKSTRTVTAVQERTAKSRLVGKVEKPAGVESVRTDQGGGYTVEDSHEGEGDFNGTESEDTLRQDAGRDDSGRAVVHDDGSGSTGNSSGEGLSRYEGRAPISESERAERERRGLEFLRQRMRDRGQ